MKSMFRTIVASAIALAGCFAFAQTDLPKDSSNEYFSFEDVLSPPTITKSECSAKKDAVWVESRWTGKGFFGGDTKEEAAGCIRYFPSNNAKLADTAVLFLHGDVLSDSFTDRKNYERTANSRAQTSLAQKMSATIGMPVIRIARPGTFGSTGADHGQRRMEIEARLVDAAVTAIREKYGYSRISIAGQSGGGGLVAALLTLGRTDLDCAVVSSGAASVKTRMQDMNPDWYWRGKDATGNPLASVYDPIDHVGAIKPDSRRRVFIVGDPRDAIVSFRSQTEFYNKLQSSNVQAVLLTAESKEPKHHVLTATSQWVAGWCKAGLSDQGMQEKLTRVATKTPDLAVANSSD
jgi:pimeloyl-ACP methyl ester carboxylesterase